MVGGFMFFYILYRAAGIGDYQGALDQLMKRRDEQLTDEHRAVMLALKAKSAAEKK